MTEHTRAHAVLSPSSAERWVDCPASVRQVESLGLGDDGGSVWAEEGTRAHTLCEIKAAYEFGLIPKEQHDARLATWMRIAEEHGDDVEEMEGCARQYVRLLRRILDETPGGALRLEQKMQTGVPGCWGTGDAVVVSPRKIVVVDYKHGKGVLVKAEGNPQLRLYGLGALETFDGVIGDAETVEVYVCQPRAGGVTVETVSAEELRAWRRDVAMPAAHETSLPTARFGPSQAACRWCPAAGDCKPRAAHLAQQDFGNPDLLSPQELADAWRRIPEYRDWCKAVEASALARAYSDRVELPGLKVVLSGGKRSVKDDGAAIERLVEAGYARDAVSRPSVQTLGALDKLVGKDALPEVLGDLLVQGKGSPSLVPLDHPGEAVTKADEAAKDFGPAPGSAAEEFRPAT